MKKTGLSFFAEAASNCFKKQGTGSAFFNAIEETTESDVTTAYAEAALAGGMAQYDMVAIAENAMILGREQGLAASLFAEASVGGFFKAILTKLISLWEKVKGYFVALAGRFKSSKSYAKDIAYIKASSGSFMAIDWTEKAVIKVPKHDWAAIFGDATHKGLVRSVFSASPAMFVKKYADQTIDQTIKAGKGIADMFDASKEKANAENTSTKKLTATLDAMQKFNDADAVAIDIYKAELPSSYISDMKLEANKKVKEETAKVFSKEIKELKGNEIRSSNILKALDAGVGYLSYAQIQKGVEEGVKFYKEKIEDLKAVLKSIEVAADKVGGDDTDAGVVTNASGASNLVTSYSATLTTFSTACILMYNTSKSILDRGIAEAKSTIDMIEKTRKNSGSTSKASAPILKQDEE